MVHKGYFTRKMSKIQSGLYKELSASLKTLSFPSLFSPASCNLLSLTEPPLSSACRPAAGAGCCLSFSSLWCRERWAELLPAQFLCNVCLTDNKEQIDFQWIRVA